MSIFNDVIIKYKDLLKEGNTLLFHINISRDKENLRLIIRKIEDLEKIYNNQNFQINIYLSSPDNFHLLNEFISNSSDNNSLFIFYKTNGKLISFDFSNKYKIVDFSKLDQLYQSNTIDYSLEIK